MSDKRFNVVGIHDERRKVRLLVDLEPENIMEYTINRTIYKKGWIGYIVDGAPRDFKNHEGYQPVLFNDYRDPLWIKEEYLENIP